MNSYGLGILLFFLLCLVPAGGFADKTSTDKFINELYTNMSTFLKKNKIRVMPNKRYCPASDYTRYIDVDHNDIQSVYEMKFTNQQQYDGQKEVQYLPWNVDSGIYLYLQSEPDIFFTDKLTGCYLAFKGKKIVHLNFKNYSESDKKKTLQSYSDYYLFTPEDYKFSTTVMGLRVNYQWTFYYQSDLGGKNFQSGKILMSDTINKYGCKSTTLTRL